MKFCDCGCGGLVPLATRTDARKGWIKGQPVRFIRQHHKRTLLAEGDAYVVDESTGCWVWQRGFIKGGYPGRIRQNGRKVIAHVLFYERHHGPVPEGMEVDHLCRNRACVNPEHLEAVTHLENIRRSAATTLTAADVVVIRAAPRSVSARELAERMGVGRSSVEHARYRRTWKDIA